MVDTCARGRWHSLHELVEAFQAEVTCLKFVTYKKSDGTSKGPKSCELLERYSTDLGPSFVVPPIASVVRQVVFPRN